MLTLNGHPSYLSPERLDHIYDTALSLAAEMGLSVQHKGLLSRLTGQDGVRLENGRVYFRTDKIETAIAAIEYPPLPHPDRLDVLGGAYTIGTQDLETGAVRKTTYDDLVRMVKLGEQLGMVGSPPVRPLDLPGPMQEVAMYRTTWEYSAARPEPLFDTTPMDGGAIAEVIYEMAQAIGKPFSVGMYLVSPFSCPPAGQDVLDAFVDRGVPVWIGTMPIAGMTAPIFMLGAHVQALAELMAGITLAHVLTQGRVPIFWTPIDSVRAHPFDMRDAVFVYGSAEDQIGTMMQAQINSRVGLPLVAKSLLTTARDPDAQAAAEKASHTLLAALLGARVVTNAGLLSVDDYISPIQMVIDHEIVEYAARVRQGSPVDDEAMGVETIREVVSGASSFIEHETTYVNFRTVAWYPEVFRHLGFKGAAQKGIPPLAEQARQRAVELINQADAVLPESQRAVLEAIYRDAEHRLKDHVTPS